MTKKISKRFKKLLESSKDKKIMLLGDAIKKVKANCTAKFDESIDVAFFFKYKTKKRRN